MAQIRVDHLTFSYDGNSDTIFDNVSFIIDTQWKLGFIGRNGRGKTTLFRLFCDEMEYRGNIASPVSFERFPFHVENPEQLVLYLIEETAPQVQLWQVVKELNLLQLDEEVLYRPFSSLSNGEQTKLMLAILFSKEHRFLLIDEPTNHLDLAGRETVKAYLNQKQGFILVSHDRNFLDGCVDHILAINKTGITVHQGNFTTWWENKINQDQFELEENTKLKKEIKRLKASARQKEGWSDQMEKTKIGHGVPDRGYVGAKSAKMMKRAKTIENRAKEAIEDKEKLLKNLEWADELKIPLLKHHQQRLIVFDHVALGYNGKEVIKDLSFELMQGEQLQLKGNNGSGKTTIIKGVLGNLPALQGKISLASGLVISYISQDTGFLKDTLDEYIDDANLDPTLFKTLLRKLDFSREQFEKPMENYSQGQKKKVLLAQSLCTPAHVYIWDEPLNYLDVFSRQQVESIIEKFRPTLIYVEHDMSFSEKIIPKVVEL